jgi:Ca2+-binding RTX toxin-like protein
MRLPILLSLMAVLAMMAVVVLVDNEQTQANHPPGAPGTVDIVAIDVDPTGNEPNGAWPIWDQCRPVSLNDTFEVDIVVDNVNSADGLSGFKFIMGYDPSKLRVLDVNDYLMIGSYAPPGATPPPTQRVRDPLPDTDGSLALDFLETENFYESGQGVISRIRLEAIGQGITSLTLTDVVLMSGSGSGLSIGTVADGELIAIDTSCPTPGPTSMPTSSPTIAPCPGPQPAPVPESLSQGASPFAVLTTDGEQDGATATDAVETEVWLNAAGGMVTIDETSISGTPPAGYEFLGQQINITAPAGSTADPLRVRFFFHCSVIPPEGLGNIVVFKDGAPVADCQGPDFFQAIPDPCLRGVGNYGTNSGQVDLWTSAASVWNLGVFTGIESTTSGVQPGDTVTTDSEGDGATASDTAETTVTSPRRGTVTITETAVAGTPPSGFGYFGQQINITAPDASVNNPLVIVFEIDDSVLPPGASFSMVVIFKNGVPVPYCTGAPSAIPDPCVASRITLANGNGQVTVLTSTASAWNLGAEIPLECGGSPIFDAVLVGTTDADNLIGTQGNDLIIGLGGNDYLSGQNGNDCIVGGDGDDALLGDGGDDVLVGGNGADYLGGGFGNDALYGGEHNDTMYGHGGDDQVRGEEGNDYLDGGDGGDLMLGGSGDDNMSGVAGNDEMCGGDNNDRMDGGDDGDQMSGGPGNDEMWGANGNDTIDPGAGSNTVDGGPGANVIGVGLGITCGEDAPLEVFCAADSDCDGYSDLGGSGVRAAEAFIGTNLWSPCSLTTAANDEPLDAWPPDLNDNKLVNAADWLTFNSRLASHEGSANYSRRWDLNGSGIITGADLLQMAPLFGRSCSS